MMTNTHLIYFSPTKTTKKVIEKLAKGLGSDQIKHYDLTFADAVCDEPINDGVAVIGIPVYGGRVPQLFLDRLQRLTSTGVPAVLVALYGNREYEDALVELRDVAIAAGFSVVAAAAFIGEHSFSTTAQPIAANRPDRIDLQKATDFGLAIAAALQISTEPGLPDIPGNVPYKERVPLGGISPVTDRNRCTLCGTCAEVCPTFVITVSAEVGTNAEKCVMCCACVKDCPENARDLIHPAAQSRRDTLFQNCSTRKEPITFIWLPKAIPPHAG
ncbi:MAG: 4Fe-4S binding protein [Desulfuromusa sp.]|nr:4Fe-4S binding protein [Desulfuromusa sp.]